MKFTLDQGLADYPRMSRIHRLNSMPVWVKREDELGFAASGYKVRKYLSLVPYLKNQGFQEAALVGSAHSNHIPALSQFLIENGIRPVIFLKGQPPDVYKGNILYTSLIVPASQTHWIPLEDWPHYKDIVHAYVTEKNRQNVKTAYVAIGASSKDALAGSLTLPLDIIRNEKEQEVTFDHIFIDAGTGMTATTLILAYAFLQKKTHIYVMQMASTPEAFTELLVQNQKDLGNLLSTSIPDPQPFTLMQPHGAPQFGSVNDEIFDFIADFAAKEGILLDPIYNAKLFLEGKKFLEASSLRGNILFIQSGGGLALSGFQEELAKRIKK